MVDIVSAGNTFTQGVDPRRTQQQGTLERALADQSRQLELAGLPQLTGVTRDQAVDRFNQEQTRQAQETALEAALDDRQLLADEIGRDLMNAGMADVAERFRRASRRQAFNFARRGLTGGSADIEQSALARADADQAAEQAAVEAQGGVLQRALQAQQERDRLSRTIVGANPLLAALEQRRLGGVEQGAADATRIAEAERQVEQAQRGRKLGIANAIGSGIGSLGGSIGAGIGGGGG